MRVITRRVGQRIKIGPNVTIIVVGTDGQQTRIGIDAPRSVPVNRGEVVERANAEKKRPPEGGL